ncbi:MAG TPA: choice-of-anchor Q domain-containing protein [Candidatus Moranbacteria bacterium]|nr:choice-of-anchor Q domain-containing protein [Candidatus Moranbacteria bacterium]
MRKKQKNLLFCLVVLGSFLLCQKTLAADICVTPSGSGTKTGADWNNAQEWSTLAFVRGNTYYLSGGEDVYESRTMDTAENGDLVITIKKATTSEHVTDTGWIASYGTDQALFEDFQSTIETSYWIIDGVDGCGALNTSCTDGNDSSKYGFKFYMTTAKCEEKFAICDPTPSDEQNLTVFRYHTADVSYVTLKHSALITCDNNYDCVCATGFHNYGRNYPTLTEGIVVQNNYFEWFQNAAAMYVTHDALFEGNYVYKVKSSSEHCHGEALNGRGSSGFIARNNYFKDIASYALGFHSYDPVNYVSKPNVDVLFYNNIIDGAINNTTSFVGCADGAYTDVLWNMKVYNNTFYNIANAASYGAVNTCALTDSETNKSYAYNNLFYNIQGAGSAKMTNGGYAGLVHDYNAYVYCSGHTDETHEVLEANDVSPVISAATSDFRLFNTSIAKDVGTSAVSDILSDDYVGTARPQNALWDIGAYEYVGAADVVAPSAPSRLSVS